MENTSFKSYTSEEIDNYLKENPETIVALAYFDKVGLFS